MGFFRKLSLKNIIKTGKTIQKVSGKLSDTVASMAGFGGVIDMKNDLKNQLSPKEEENLTLQVASEIKQSGKATSDTDALLQAETLVATSKLQRTNPNAGQILTGAGVGAVQGILDTLKNDSNTNNVLATATDNVVMAYLKKHGFKILGIITGVTVVVFILFKVLGKSTTKKRF